MNSAAGVRLPVVSASKATSRSKPSRKFGHRGPPKQRQFLCVSLIDVTREEDRRLSAARRTAALTRQRPCYVFGGPWLLFGNTTGPAGAPGGDWAAPAEQKAGRPAPRACPGHAPRLPLRPHLQARRRQGDGRPTVPEQAASVGGLISVPQSQRHVSALHHFSGRQSEMGQRETIRCVSDGGSFSQKQPSGLPAQQRCDIVELANTCSKCSCNAGHLYDA